MDYYIIAVHQDRGAIKNLRYILSLDDSRVMYEKKVEEVIRDINSMSCTVYTALRNSDGTYKKGSRVIIKSTYLTTVGNKRSKDNLDNLPQY